MGNVAAELVVNDDETVEEAAAEAAEEATEETAEEAAVDGVVAADAADVPLTAPVVVALPPPPQALSTTANASDKVAPVIGRPGRWCWLTGMAMGPQQGPQ